MMEEMGQGQRVVTDSETGRSYIIPQGGSDGEVSVGDSTEGTVQPSQEVQPPVEQQPAPQAPAQEGGDQGFLAEYLKDVPEEQRPVVQPILEKYRQDQDRNFNQRFEQIREEAKIPTMLHQALLEDPITTLNWVADKMLEERGLDIRKELLGQWGQGQQVQPQEPGNQPGQQETPSVEEMIQKAIEEREQQQLQTQKQQDFQQQQAQQQAQTVNTWVDQAAKSFSLSLDDTNGEDPLRAVIIMQANQLHESGVARGQAAVEMAVESVSKRFGGAPPANGGPQPRVADGGSPPPAQPIDVSNEKERRARMMELFPSGN